MALSDVFLSTLSGGRARLRRSSQAAMVEPLPPEKEELRRCVLYRSCFPMAEIAFPATMLRNHLIARWVRADNVAVDVRTSDDLGVALAVGVHPARLTVHANGVAAHELVSCAATLAVSRVVVDSAAQLDVLCGAVGPQRRQAVLLQMVDVSDRGATGPRGVTRFGRGCNDAIATALGSPRLTLIGLHGDVGAHDADFLSYPAAIGDMIAEMARIRDVHGQVLSRASLAGPPVLDGEGAPALPGQAVSIDSLLEDACAILRFPRPLSTLSAGGRAHTGRSAA